MVDIVVAGSALIVLSPVMLFCAVGAKLSSPGPAIFRQMRVGRGGAVFEFYKFRSMPADTRDVASDELGEVQLRPFGWFLRRSNLDELPQLVNILKGDMSLVGPRPPIPTQSELIVLRRENGALDCRPGLTGLAQINSFDGMSAAEKAAFDGVYAQRMSLLSDIAIVLRTFGYLKRTPPKY
ncbi:sugar transferase [Tsuneonella dongtanensis]|uniref:sugar transferase n=1 Tax=Tsuneonella dongtanensis TaxID=692370 RepID=UPI0018DC9DEB|nr:sugar transferase [Tsuneonella dongtanensis]